MDKQTGLPDLSFRGFKTFNHKDEATTFRNSFTKYLKNIHLFPLNDGGYIVDLSDSYCKCIGTYAQPCNVCMP